MMTKETMVKKLVDDDIETVHLELKDGDENLNCIRDGLRFGHIGYSNWTEYALWREILWRGL